MTRPAINPGKVDWSGENPGMYLKETADGPFVTLISFFRVVLSPHGKGHAAFMLLDPQGNGKDPARPNVCLTETNRSRPICATVSSLISVHSRARPGCRTAACIPPGTSWPPVTAALRTRNGSAAR